MQKKNYYNLLKNYYNFFIVKLSEIVRLWCD